MLQRNPAIDTTGEVLMTAASKAFVTMPGTKASVAARLQGVSKNYGPVQALKNVNLEVRSGELLAVLGPNGAGKTTAVKLLLGLAAPNAGTVTLFGSDPSLTETRSRSGAMLQVSRVPETLKVREHIDLFSSYYANPLPFSAVVAAAGLKGLENRKF